MSKVRIDKWLWSVRIFKSRSIATEACKKGNIKVRDKVVKPSHLLGGEEILEVRKNGFNFLFKVNKLIDKRVSATLAQPCYEDLTSEEELNKYNRWFIGKSQPEIRERGTGRPTKKERRVIEEFKTGYYEFDDSL